jgi:hypothetical protein
MDEMVQKKVKWGAAGGACLKIAKREVKSLYFCNRLDDYSWAVSFLGQQQNLILQALG